MSVNKVVYNGKTLIDLTSDTVTEDTLLNGATAHMADGSVVTGMTELVTYYGSDPLRDSNGNIILDSDSEAIEADTVMKLVYNSRKFVETTYDTVTEDVLLKGYTAHDKYGNAVTGTIELQEYWTYDTLCDSDGEELLDSDEDTLGSSVSVGLKRPPSVSLKKPF